MDESSPYGWFIQEWKEYLRIHRQTILPDSDESDIIQSMNTKTGRYRWILKCVEEDTYRVSGADRKSWRRQLRLAQQLREKCYLVIKFGSPAGQAVIIPIRKAIRLKRISSGIVGTPDCNGVFLPLNIFPF